MCCHTTRQPLGQFPLSMPVANCGCGCIGVEQTIWRLENYREHLKTELASVEKQIQAAKEQ